MNDNIEVLLIDLQYFANVNWYKKVDHYKYIIFTESDRHVKMSFRNRLWLSGADGLLSLSIPLEASRNEKQLYKDVNIAPGNWATSHFRTITSCYNRSPWFEYYRDELAVLYATPQRFLWDWNLACFNWLNQHLPLPGGYYPPGENKSENKLFAEVHAPVFVELAEIRIAQVFNKPDRFTGTFHFRTEFFIYSRELIEAENWLFNSKSFQLFLKGEIG